MGSHAAEARHSPAYPGALLKLDPSYGLALR
jgi:hypothetical protein